MFGAGGNYNAIPVVKNLECSIKTKFDSIEEQLNTVSQDKKLQESRPMISSNLIAKNQASAKHFS